MDTADYTEHCELLLNNREFYEKLDANPTPSYVEEVRQKIDGMLKIKFIRKQECSNLAENLENPLPRLPKIDKIFNSCPPLRRIVSGFAHAMCHLLIIS